MADPSERLACGERFPPTQAVGSRLRFLGNGVARNQVTESVSKGLQAYFESQAIPVALPFICLRSDIAAVVTSTETTCVV
jgi:hypothetical protein